MATLAEMLADAEAAYHRLMTGQAVRVLVDQNGERIEYTVASARNLLAYITSLGGPTWNTGGSGSGPMRVWL